MRGLLVSFLMGVAMVAGAAGEEVAKDVAEQTEETGETTLEFFDSGSFDKKLSKALRDDLEVVSVEFPAPTSVNTIPERLDKWLAAVEKDEGKVELKPDPDHADRGILSEVLSLTVKVFKFGKKKRTYSPAEDYDTTVYYLPGSGTITRVDFKRKESLDTEEKK